MIAHSYLLMPSVIQNSPYQCTSIVMTDLIRTT